MFFLVQDLAEAGMVLQSDERKKKTSVGEDGRFEEAKSKTF